MPDLYVSSKKDEGAANPLAAFVANPSGIRFETQEEEEKIILLLRMHWITNVPWIFLAILLLFAPLVLRSFPLLDFLPARYQLISLMMWYLLVTAFILEQFLTWFFNVYIITDERIVDIDFYGLLHREISDAKIDKIQDVSVKWSGIVSTIFNYGDVFIQTASERPKFEFHAVPSPERVAKILQGLRTQEEIEAIEGRIR